MSPGRRVCVGGVGPIVREKGVSTTKSTACICTAAEARLRAGLGGASLPPGIIAQANAANAQAHYEEDAGKQIKGRRTPIPGETSGGGGGGGEGRAKTATPTLLPGKTTNGHMNETGK